MKTAEDFPYQDIISLHRRFCGRCAFLGTGAWCGCGAESVYEILAALEDGETWGSLGEKGRMTKWVVCNHHNDDDDDGDDDTGFDDDANIGNYNETRACFETQTEFHHLTATSLRCFRSFQEPHSGHSPKNLSNRALQRWNQSWSVPRQAADGQTVAGWPWSDKSKHCWCAGRWGISTDHVRWSTSVVALSLNRKPNGVSVSSSRGLRSHRQVVDIVGNRNVRDDYIDMLLNFLFWSICSVCARAWVRACVFSI